jgi:hypothetical protein
MDWVCKQNELFIKEQAYAAIQRHTEEATSASDYSS